MAFFNLPRAAEEDLLWALGGFDRHGATRPMPPLFLSATPEYAVPRPATEPAVVLGNPSLQLVYPLVQAELRSWGIDAERSGPALREVGLPEDFVSRAVATLSGGEQVRLALACLWSRRPRPSSALLHRVWPWLDKRGREMLQLQLRRMTGAGARLFLFENDLEALAACQRVVGGPDRRQERLGLPPRSAPAQPVVELENVTFGYPRAAALFENLSLSVSGGEILGLVGPNGAGKSTLAALIAGLLKPLSGRIRYGGQYCGGLSSFQRSRWVTVHFQNPYLQTCSQDAFHEVRFGLEPKEASRAQEFLGRFGLADAGKPLSLLSTYELRLVLLSLSLARSPRVLILDEPTWDLNEDEKRLFLGHALGGAARQGAAVVLISHDAALLHGLCDRTIDVGILGSGRPLP